MNKKLVLKNYLFFCVFICAISVFFNAFICTFKNIDISLDNIQSDPFVSKFFTVVNIPADIISSMMSDNSQNSNKKHNGNTTKISFDDISIITICSFLNDCKTVNKYIIEITDKIISNVYQNVLVSSSLKIHLWRCIVFVLLFRLLFNILPRSVSVKKMLYTKKLVLCCRKVQAFLFWSEKCFR